MKVSAKLKPSDPELIRASEIRVGYQTNLFGTTYECVCPPERSKETWGAIEICFQHTESKEIVYIKLPEDLGISVAIKMVTSYKELKDFLPGGGKLGVANIEPDEYGILFHGDVEYIPMNGDTVGSPVEVSK